MFAKRPIVEFYRAFLKSPNFASWLRQRTNEVFRIWRSKYLHILSTCDISSWLNQNLSDSLVEGIELLMRLREVLVFFTHQTRYSPFFVIDGETVRLAYISNQAAHVTATPLPVIPPIEPSPQALEEILEIQGSVDLASVRFGAQSRHLKAKTAPLPTRPYTDSLEILSKEISAIKDVKSTISNSNPSQLIEKLKQKPKNNSKSLSSLGEFIPSAEQYTQLIAQMDLLLSLLPKELSGNIGNIS